MKLPLIQGSPEWLSLKYEKIGASDVGPIMGVSEFNTPYQIWERMIQRLPYDGNYTTEKGKMDEPVAVARLEKQYGLELLNLVYQHDTRPYMIASLDAYNEQSGRLFEIKCGSKAFKLALEGVISPSYYYQCQTQMEVLGLDDMTYCAFNREADHLIEIVVRRNTKDIKNLLDACEQFWHYYKTQTPPPFMEKDYITIENHEDLVEKLRLAQDAFEKTRDEYQKLREEVLALCNNHNSILGPLKVTKVVAKGSIEYDRIPELIGVNRDLYRKEPNVSFRFNWK